jgi:PLP dependent protein
MAAQRPARPGFATVRALADSLGLEVCSMGMSDDLDVAISEGATEVRIGTGLFGPRQ